MLLVDENIYMYVSGRLVDIYVYIYVYDLVKFDSQILNFFWPEMHCRGDCIFNCPYKWEL
jgi:hypothetical protein